RANVLASGTEVIREVSAGSGVAGGRTQCALRTGEVRTIQIFPLLECGTLAAGNRALSVGRHRHAETGQQNRHGKGASPRELHRGHSIPTATRWEAAPLQFD